MVLRRREIYRMTGIWAVSYTHLDVYKRQGYDPIFLVGKKTYAELTPSEKDAVSHRGKALQMCIRDRH